MVRFLAAIIFVSCMGISSCASSKIKSLCIFDFNDQMCWVDKPKNIGYSLQQIDLFFAMDETDLKAILKKLNQCQNQQNLQ